MANHEIPPHGAFCWNELGTTDLEAAQKFYKELLGWQIQESTGAGMVYNEIVVGGRHVGGLYQLTEQQGGGPSRWTAYVAVDDVDAAAKRVEELGGRVCVPPMDIPNTGRFCSITDPTGATISLITLQGAGPSNG